jgi:hypothetical protein
MLERKRAHPDRHVVVVTPANLGALAVVKTSMVYKNGVVR